MFSRRNALSAAFVSLLTLAAFAPFLRQRVQMSPFDPTLSAAPLSLPLDGVRAPEFPPGFSWFNTKAPLSLKQLRGKIVLLDFWTYGCINCLHIIPDLKKLEAKYPNELVVIGVHSAKFDHEAKPENVRKAVLRYGLEHPVVADENRKIWSDYAVRAWPTLVLIGADGKIAQTWAGEGNGDAIEKYTEFLIQKARREKILDDKPFVPRLERTRIAASPLSFPGKIARWKEKIIVADSSHHRLVILESNGKTSAVLGTGAPGLTDGNFASAQFSNPQGMWVEGDVLWIADTNNHAIRRVDLTAKTIETIAGIGKQASWGTSGGPAKTSALSSPWDVLKHGDGLFIAMAGTHQIWRLDFQNQTVSPWAGTGGEARRDGDRQAALFAQPSGLASDGKSLFVADSESSCIRAIDFGTGQVKTLAGGDLFTFGDRDGRGDSALLKHPLGLDFKDGFLYLADTYNSKIKRLNPQNGEVQTVFSGGLDEPSGLVFDGDSLLVADTGNHQIKRLDLAKRRAQTLAVSGLQSPTLAPQIASQTGAVASLARGQRATLRIDVAFPQGFKLNTEAPQNLEIRLEGSAKPLAQFDTETLRLPVSLSFTPPEKGTVVVSGTLNYCDTGKGAVCKIERVELKLPFQTQKSGEKILAGKIELP